MYIYIYQMCIYIYVIVCIFLNGAASCDWWNIGTIWYRLLVCFPTMYCSGVATEWRRDSDQLPKRWHSSSMTRNCYHQHSVHGKPNGILLTMMLSCPAFWPFHWGCQQCWQHLYEPGAGYSIPCVAGGAEVGEPEQKTTCPSNLKSDSITANHWFPTYDSKRFRLSLELPNFWIAPVPSCELVCVQLGCGLMVCTYPLPAFGFCSKLMADLSKNAGQR